MGSVLWNEAYHHQYQQHQHHHHQHHCHHHHHHTLLAAPMSASLSSIGTTMFTTTTTTTTGHRLLPSSSREFSQRSEQPTKSPATRKAECPNLYAKSEDRDFNQGVHESKEIQRPRSSYLGSILGLRRPARSGWLPSELFGR